MSDEQAEKDAWSESRFRGSIIEQIEERILSPGDHVEFSDTDSDAQWRARAVAALFETAEPAAGSKLRTIDLPAELVAAAKELRNAADDAVQDHEQEAADRLGFLANCVEDTSHLIVEPARMLQTLIHDRDQWQVLEKQAEEMLALTEAALGVSQKSNVALAEGQSKLIELLECVARWCDRHGDPGFAFLPDIHAVLNQVTAIETDAAGRLSVAAQPKPDTEETIG